jgi:hypothetical protein
VAIIVRKPRKVGQFADFLNPFIGIVNILFVGYLTYALNELNNRREQKKGEEDGKREKENEKRRRALERPVLTFVSTPLDEMQIGVRISTFLNIKGVSEYATSSELWSLFNIGNGPALNLTIAYKTHRVHSNWEKPIVKANSIAKEGNRPLEWIDWPDVLCVIYSDLTNTQYVSVFADDELETRIYSEEEFKPILLKEATIAKPDVDKILLVKQIRLPAALSPFRTMEKWNEMYGSETGIPEGLEDLDPENLFKPDYRSD